MYNKMVEVEPYIYFLYADRGIAAIGSRERKKKNAPTWVLFIYTYLFIYFYF